MKKLSFISVILIFCFVSASSQPCLPDGITFSSQAQIDSFQINYPNCTEIEGDVLIHGNDITNLNGLSVLTSIGGYLDIDDNYTLSSLTGLENVTSIGGNLRIEDNYALTNLIGLDGVTSIGGNLELWYNYFLTSLTGLENVTTIGEHLSIWGNLALSSLTGLENVTTIGGNLWIAGNNAITSLTELDNVTSIGGDIRIIGNPALTSLTGLKNVTSIGGSLWIEYNDALTSLTGLENIDAASITDLFIKNNITLATCHVLSVCNFLANPSGTIEIQSNAIGCNSSVEVQDSCIANSVFVNELKILNEIEIYPNPSSTHITIELPTAPQKNTFLTIYNLNGQQLITQPITEPQTVVDVSGLPSGVYFVKVVDDDEVMMGKMIKQ